MITVTEEQWGQFKHTEHWKKGAFSVIEMPVNWIDLIVLCKLKQSKTFTWNIWPSYELSLYENPSVTFDSAWL